MLHDFFHWVQWELGKGPGENSVSWSQALLESLNFWGVLEGTHLLSIMLFFGTIFVVDMRLLGLLFKDTPVSRLSDKTLPLTVIGFAVLIVTGVLLFFAKPETHYYHNLWFRLKLLFIILAMINIAVFHKVVQRDQARWDLGPTPSGAKLSAVLSLVLWLGVITFGRFIAYNWYDCGTPQSDFLNAVQECAVSEKGATNLQGVHVGGAH